MKRLLFRISAVAAVVAVVAVPAASAKTHAVKLSLLPLQKGQLGAGKALPLEHDSGVVTNADAAAYSIGGAAPSTFKKFGRVTGYDLDYGIGSSGGSGITEVTTNVDQYTTTRGPKQALAFWKGDDQKITELDAGGLGVTGTGVSVPRVGGARFAFLASYSATNITPVYEFDEHFTEGKYEAEVTVWAGTATEAKDLAPKLAKTLDARIKQAVAGKLRAKPVKLPPAQQPGAVQGSPDLQPLVLKTTDLSGTATVQEQGWSVDPAALTDYGVLMIPAGPFGLLDHEVEWYATPNEAAFEADFAMALTSGPHSAPVDMTGVGDGAQGLIAIDSTGDFFGLAVLNSGRLSEFIEVISQTAIQPSDLQNAARTAATYLNNAGLGG